MPSSVSGFLLLKEAPYIHVLNASLLPGLLTTIAAAAMV